jgi:hypothetical protein
MSHLNISLSNCSLYSEHPNTGLVHYSNGWFVLNLNAPYLSYSLKTSLVIKKYRALWTISPIRFLCQGLNTRPVINWQRMLGTNRSGKRMVVAFEEQNSICLVYLNDSSIRMSSIQLITVCLKCYCIVKLMVTATAIVPGATSATCLTFSRNKVMLI